MQQVILANKIDNQREPTGAHKSSRKPANDPVPIHAGGASEKSEKCNTRQPYELINIPFDSTDNVLPMNQNSPYLNYSGY